MRKCLLLVAALALTSCAALNELSHGPDYPGSGINYDTASRWGCNAAIIKIEAQELIADLEPGKTYIPQVGWDACKLLAHNGAPRDYDYQMTRYGRSASLWYGSPMNPHLVSMEHNEASGKWTITYVGW
jgi:hypothetical protein